MKSEKKPYRPRRTMEEEKEKTNRKRPHSPHMLESSKNDSRAGESSEESIEDSNEPPEKHQTLMKVGPKQLKKDPIAVPGSSGIQKQGLETKPQYFTAVDGTKPKGDEILKDASMLPDEEDGTCNQEMEYESFLGLLGCLEVRGNTNDGLHNGKVDQPGETCDGNLKTRKASDEDGQPVEPCSEDSFKENSTSAGDGSKLFNPLIDSSTDIERPQEVNDGGNDKPHPKCGVFPSIRDANDFHKEGTQSCDKSNEYDDADLLKNTSIHSDYTLTTVHVGVERSVPENGILQGRDELIISQSKTVLTECGIGLPKPENLRRHSWLVKSARKYELGSSGFAYEGGIAAEKMHGHGRLMLGDDRQFIEGTWSVNHLVQLRFCQFTFNRGSVTIFIIKRVEDYLLTVHENHFAARVMLDSIDELDFTMGIRHLKQVFFEKLSVLEILEDEQKVKRQESLRKFESFLKTFVSEYADPITKANILVLIRKYSQYSDCNLSDLAHNQTIPAELQNALGELLECESRYLDNSRIMSILNKPEVEQLDLREMFSEIYRVEIEKRRQILISKCPNALPSLAAELQTMDGSQMVYVTEEDINVFDHLASLSCLEFYENFFKHLIERFCQYVSNIDSCTPPYLIIPVMPPVYGFLFKSFLEIISEITELTGVHKFEDMLKYESGSWKLEDNIKWTENENDDTQNHGVLAKFFKPSGKKSTLYHRALEIQYRITFQVIEHFSPGSSFTKKTHNFNFNVLEQDLSWWEKGLKVVSKKVGLARRLKNLSEERLVWLYILDYTIHNVFRDVPENHALLKPYKTLLQGQISFIEKSPTESHESFRVLTHSIVKFVTSTAPYFRGTPEKPGVDVEILVQQMWTFSTASQDIEQDPLTFSKFRDLIAEYNRYLSLRLFIDIEPAPGYFSSQISEMMQTFMGIVKTSLEKNSVPTAALVGYFRSLNDFLDDFKNMDFLRMWYVKSMFYNTEFMEKVKNKLSASGNCSYRVTDVEKYVQAFNLVRHQPPNHFIIQVVSHLLHCIESCLVKQWLSGDGKELQVAQLESTSVMLDAVRRSFLYLKEQPNYVDFEVFKKESLDPFVRLVNGCSTLDDLKKRATIVKESFWYIRKMDEIGIDQALTLFRLANNILFCDQLLSCYNLYLTHYNDYIAKYTSLLSDGKSDSEGLNAVLEILPQTKELHFSKWTEEFKTRGIPVLLAGFSAIWSILESKDVSSCGKFLKPHCIQILCVMRLLSVDKSKTTDNHLAQVLTGQGKSVILGLLSSVLAHTGHKVKVLCYSKYLSSRDQNNFQEFFETLRITDKINYGTFKEMAGGFFNPICNGTRTSLSHLVEDRVLNHTRWSSLGSVTTESQDTVLLIDEVDVFFSNELYGNEYTTVVIIGMDALVKIQEKMWSLATNEKISAKQMVQKIMKVIKNEVTARNSHFVDLNAFLNKPGSFPLLTYEGNNLCIRQYTNKSLFDEQLLLMASDSLKVAKRHDDDCGRKNFVLNNQDVICAKGNDNMYHENNYYWYYLNVFNYFRLKRSDYDSKNFKNYGYMKLQVGTLSYARLPSQFQLIMGVSGTITNLGDYEKRGIRSYNIHNFTILPSFFGESNLKFEKKQNFHYFLRVRDWLKKIYDRVNHTLQSRRAVLVFFESDTTMNIFSKEYKPKFDRLNELTPNTNADYRDLYINEAGLSCTVTLATRDMGRGVDYKSSLSVEKNGGVHVIQTFFSIDVKEEIQIKGRTARRDNKGSYEMIICKEHLVRDAVITKEDYTSHNYSSLDYIRRELSFKKGETVTENIRKCERNHITTMHYFGLT